MPNNSLSENKPLLATLAVVVVVIVAMIWFFLNADKDTEKTNKIAVPVAPAPVVAPEPKPEPEPEPQPELPPPEPAFVLPLLDQSDELVRDGVVSLTRHEGVNAWLAPKELIRKFVAFTDNVAHGQVAKDPVRSLAPEGPFLVRKIDDNTFELDPASYNRYNKFTEVIVSMDSRRAAEFYHLIEPLVRNAYGELGYGDKSFDAVVFQSIGRLLETPIVDGPIRLVRPTVMYKFEDQRLENLSPVQKQLIRMGPKNMRLLQAKLSEIAVELRAILENG